MQELISVIVPVYNVEKYLFKCVESIRKQTYKTLQIILVNDGSTDGSLAICRALEKEDSRIQVVDKENGGLSSARNRGLDLAKGEYVTFIDSDDYINDNFIEELYRVCLDKAVDMVVSGYKERGEEEEILRCVQFENKELTAKEAIEALCYERNFTCYAWAKFYKRTLFDEYRFEEGRLFEDISIMYRLLDSCKKIKIVSLMGYQYLIRRDSIAHSKFKEEQMVLTVIMDELIAYIQKKYPDLLRAAIRRRNFTYFWLCQQIENSNFQSEQVRRLINSNIKQDIPTVLFDLKSSMKDKIKCLLYLIGGPKMYLAVFNRYVRR